MSNNALTGFGWRLRKIRKHLKESQTQFAERFGLTRDDVSNYELERCEPPLEVLAGIDRCISNRQNSEDY